MQAVVAGSGTGTTVIVSVIGSLPASSHIGVDGVFAHRPGSSN